MRYLNSLVATSCLTLSACHGMGGFASGFGHLASGLGHAASGLGHVAGGVARAASGLGRAVLPVARGVAQAAPYVIRVAGDVAVEAALNADLLDAALDTMTWGTVDHIEVVNDDSDAWHPAWDHMPSCDDRMGALVNPSASTVPNPAYDYCL